MKDIRATDRKLPRQLWRCLALAGVKRAELFATNDPTRKAITFHDLRADRQQHGVPSEATNLCALRAGPRSFSTTEGYIREAENLRDGFGEVFPLLPQQALLTSRGRTVVPLDSAGSVAFRGVGARFGARSSLAAGIRSVP